MFIDETGTHIGMTRTYARALRGHPAVGVAPRNRGQTLTLISAMTHLGIQSQMVIEGAVTGDVFVEYVRQVLLPKLRAGQVVIMDGLGAHHRPEVKTLLEASGCSLILLPSYSPDFNPIECAFAWLKAYLRSVGAGTRKELIAAIARAGRLIGEVLASAWFVGCGYLV